MYKTWGFCIQKVCSSSPWAFHGLNWHWQKGNVDNSAGEFLEPVYFVRDAGVADAAVKLEVPNKAISTNAQKSPMRC